MAKGPKEGGTQPPKAPGTVWNAGIYARLSVDHHNQKNESIETQIEAAKTYISQFGDIALAGCYVDLGKTGTDFEREGFEAMMADVRRHRINCVVVKDFSRFGRNYIETGNYMEKIFPFFKVRFISVSDGYDSHAKGEADLLSIRLKHIVDELYAQDCAHKVKAAKKLKLEQGCYVGGVPPYGYLAEWADGKRVLVPEAGASDVVRAIFRLFDSGKGVGSIISWLYGAGIHRPSEHRRTKHVRCEEGETVRQWSGQTIRAMLTNPVYIGVLAQIKAGEKAYRAGGLCSVEPDGVALAEHAHQPIVGEDVFYRVSCKIEAGKKKGVPGKGMPEDIFKGLLWCGECGCRLKRVCTSNPRSYQVSVRTYSYGCPHIQRIDGLKCSSHFISSNMVKKIVLEALQKAINLSGAPCKAWQGCRTQKERQAEDEWRKKQKEIQANIQRSEIELSSLYRQYRSGTVEEEAFLAAKEEKEAEKNNLAKELSEQETRLRRLKETLREREDLARCLWDGEKSMNLDGLLVGAMVERITVYRDRRVEVLFRFRK